ncbi:hypothetical protein E4U39_007240, partial [Claviceps sp. Clav50 group G5]
MSQSRIDSRHENFFIPRHLDNAALARDALTPSRPHAFSRWYYHNLAQGAPRREMGHNKLNRQDESSKNKA